MICDQVEAKPTGDDIRAEAERRVDARHRGCVPPAPEALEDEYAREALYVGSLSHRYPWSEIVPVPVAELVQLGSGCSVRSELVVVEPTEAEIVAAERAIAAALGEEADGCLYECAKDALIAARKAAPGVSV